MTDEVAELSPTAASSFDVPVQAPLPLAFIHGQALLESPHDLYIPPDALEVILESFSGPLDLLLYLIRRQKFDILALPITDITTQYMTYVDAMLAVKLELAADYLLMAAILMEIKSRLLLPKPPESQEDEEDPRAELVRRLQAYEQARQAASELDQRPRLERDLFFAQATAADTVVPIRIAPEVDIRDLVLAFADVMKRAAAFAHHKVSREALSTRERMSQILDIVGADSFVEFTSLFRVNEGVAGVVVSFLAILELVKEGLLVCIQSAPFAPIHVKLGQHEQD